MWYFPSLLSFQYNYSINLSTPQSIQHFLFHIHPFNLSLRSSWYLQKKNIEIQWTWANEKQKKKRLIVTSTSRKGNIRACQRVVLNALSFTLHVHCSKIWEIPRSIDAFPNSFLWYHNLWMKHHPFLVFNLRYHKRDFTNFSHHPIRYSWSAQTDLLQWRTYSNIINMHTWLCFFKKLPFNTLLFLLIFWKEETKTAFWFLKAVMVSNKNKEV